MGVSYSVLESARISGPSSFPWELCFNFIMFYCLIIIEEVVNTNYRTRQKNIELITRSMRTKCKRRKIILDLFAVDYAFCIHHALYHTLEGWHVLYISETTFSPKIIY